MVEQQLVLGASVVEKEICIREGRLIFTVPSDSIYGGRAGKIVYTRLQEDHIIGTIELTT